MEKVYGIDSGYYFAGVVVKDNIVTEAAPILKWTISENFEELKKYFTRKGFKIYEAI